MYKIGIGVFCLILALIFGNAMVIAGNSDGDYMSVPMGIIQLDPPDSVENPKPPVNFPHSIHFEFNCRTCHHQWEFDEPIQNCRTSGCHDGLVAPTKAEKGEDPEELKMSYYKNAYHKLCIGCHRDMKHENRKLELSGRVLKENLPATGPTGCKQCHVPE